MKIKFTDKTDERLNWSMYLH